MPSDKQTFLTLVQLGAGQRAAVPEEDVDWAAVQEIAGRQGLSAVVLDGVERLPKVSRPPKHQLLEWIGQVAQDEERYAVQMQAAEGMARLFHENGIRTYVLKGRVVAECYPKPEHRRSADMDCFLLPDAGTFDAWERGNELIATKGHKVITGFYKNSTFYLPGLMVENHKFLTPFRGNKCLAALERLLQEMIHQDKGEDHFEGTWLYRPPLMASALFLIEHAYSHFLHEGLTWRHVLDWMMFSRKHEAGLNWDQFHALIDEFGFRRFYNSYLHMGQYMLGERTEASLSSSDLLMLEDMWATISVPETLHGFKAKLTFARNTIRARWKYRHYSEISMPRGLWIQVKGFFFIRHPKLD